MTCQALKAGDGEMFPLSYVSSESPAPSLRPEGDAGCSCVFPALWVRQMPHVCSCDALCWGVRASLSGLRFLRPGALGGRSPRTQAHSPGQSGARRTASWGKTSWRCKHRIGLVRISPMHWQERQKSRRLRAGADALLRAKPSTQQPHPSRPPGPATGSPLVPTLNDRSQGIPVVLSLATKQAADTMNPQGQRAFHR